MRGHTSPRRLALLFGNALVKVGAACTFSAHLRLRSLKETIANCSEDSVYREPSAKSNSIDECRGEDDDTTFHLSLHFQIEESVRLILLKSTAISHAVFDYNLINASVLVTIFHTILIRKVIRAIAAVHELCNIIPPLGSNSIRITMLLPNTDATQTLLDDICSRNTVIKVIIGVCRAVPSVVCAQVEAHVLPIKTLAITFDSIIHIHVGSKVRTVPQCFSNGLEFLLKILAHWIGGSGPQIVFYAIIRLGKRPLHLNLNGMVRTDFGYNLVSIHFEHEEGGNGDVSPGSIVGHDRFGRLAYILSVSRDAIVVGAETRVVRNNHPCSSRLLRITDLLDEGTSASVDHKDVGCRPRFHLSFAVLRADGISLAAVDGGIAEIGISIVDALRNGTTVGRDSE
mmetsp:Transcript_21161/g.34428  ORF Transcript_21161/g.34428 Transcript_21161/m.34428 type:complete len:399 (-) Transcript_21161:272-1468(-)